MSLISNRLCATISVDAFRSWKASKNIELNKYIWLDLIERVAVAAMFGFFASNMYLALDIKSSVAVPLLIASEMLPILLIVGRKWSRSHQVSDKPLDWMLAFVGANAPLMCLPGVPGTLVSQELCSLVILIGFLIQVSAKLVLWRSFGIVAAAREIKFIGPYRIVRHPMYAGYTIAHIGFLLAFPSIWNLFVYVGALIIQIARLLREEKLLNQHQSYREFCSRVRYRLVPGLF